MKEKRKKCIICGKSLAVVCHKDYMKLKQQLEEEKNYTTVLQKILDKIRDGLRNFWKK